MGSRGRTSVLGPLPRFSQRCRDDLRSLTIARNCGNRKSGIIRPRPVRVTPPLFGGDDEVRIRRRRGICSFRQFQETIGVILPFIAPAVDQFPHRFTQHAVVNQSINNIGLHIQPSLCWLSGSRTSFFRSQPTPPTRSQQKHYEEHLIYI